MALVKLDNPLQHIFQPYRGKIKVLAMYGYHYPMLGLLGLENLDLSFFEVKNYKQVTSLKDMEAHFELFIKFLATVKVIFLLIDSTNGDTPINRDGAMNKPQSGSEYNQSRTQQDLASRSLGSAMFPDEDTEEGIFHMEVLLACQRWFSSQGWPGGQFPIVIPNGLRW